MSKNAQTFRELNPELLRTRIQRRAESALELLVAVAIGVGLAALLVAWWSS